MTYTGPVPTHVGFVMDGNGRWARERRLPRTVGHREGLETAKKIIRSARELGIQYITLYIFSTENWKRAETEVSFLMGLIRKHLRKEMDFYRKNQLKVLHSGDIHGLPRPIRHDIRTLIQDTRHFTGMTVNLAINYGGRDEIVRAVNRWLRNRKKNSHLTEDLLKNHLDCPEIPDPDLIIRTSGELRTSNFLLWESAYAEFYPSSKYWPDFDDSDLLEAVKSYSARDRRYGGTKTK